MENKKDNKRSNRLRKQLSLLVGSMVLIFGLYVSFVDGTASGVWYIDTDKCIGCGDCATECIRTQSAVRAVIDTIVCPGLDECRAFYKKPGKKYGTGIANQNCPTGALKREKRGEKYLYTIDESKCIGCGKCFRGCRKCEHAISLVVKQNICLNCNDCKIEPSCPTGAFKYGKISKKESEK